MSTPLDSHTLGEGSDLRTILTFPHFQNCPYENDFDETYYQENRGVLSPKQHWCFIGEIEANIEWPLRVMLHVRDKRGERILVAFHTEDRGMLFEPLCKPNNTIAILYANSHWFADGQVGFRVEEASIVKIFPFSLNNFMSANLLLRTPRSTECKTLGCSKNKDLMVCSRCHITKYCGKDHQNADWKEHKSVCKAVVALRWFTQKNWMVFRPGGWFTFF